MRSCHSHVCIRLSRYDKRATAVSAEIQQMRDVFGLRYVSFSLFGKDKDYLEGAIRNCATANDFYPGWTPIFYVAADIEKKVTRELEKHGGRVIASDQTVSRNPRAWRFAAALLDDAEHVIFRDTDSRMSRRESDAVMQWLDSGKTLHIMRDHPHHGHPIMAGMWGINVGEKPRRLISKVLQEAIGEEKPEDQQLLGGMLRSFRTVVSVDFLCR